jgi:hypothetical protein
MSVPPRKPRPISATAHLAGARDSAARGRNDEAAKQLGAAVDVAHHADADQKGVLIGGIPPLFGELARKDAHAASVLKVKIDELEAGILQGRLTELDHIAMYVRLAEQAGAAARVIRTIDALRADASSSRRAQGRLAVYASDSLSAAGRDDLLAAYADTIMAYNTTSLRAATFTSDERSSICERVVQQGVLVYRSLVRRGAHPGAASLRQDTLALCEDADAHARLIEVARSLSVTSEVAAIEANARAKLTGEALLRYESQSGSPSRAPN